MVLLKPVLRYMLGAPDGPSMPAGATNATQEARQETALRLRRCPAGGDEYTAYCGMEGQVMNHLFPLPAANASGPTYSMRAEQYSVGLWPINCLNGTTAGGWTNGTLHEFLMFLDEVGVRSVDVFGTSGTLEGPIQCGECGWFLERLRWWKYNGK